MSQNKNKQICEIYLGSGFEIRENSVAQLFFEGTPVALSDLMQKIKQSPPNERAQLLAQFIQKESQHQVLTMILSLNGISAPVILKIIFPENEYPPSMVSIWPYAGFWESESEIFHGARLKEDPGVWGGSWQYS